MTKLFDDTLLIGLVVHHPVSNPSSPIISTSTWEFETDSFLYSDFCFVINMFFDDNVYLGGNIILRVTIGKTWTIF